MWTLYITVSPINARWNVYRLDVYTNRRILSSKPFDRDTAVLQCRKALLVESLDSLFMDRCHQDSPNQKNTNKNQNDSFEGDVTTITLDLYKRKRIHLLSHGTQHWKNFAFLIAVYDIMAVNLSHYLAL